MKMRKDTSLTNGTGEVEEWITVKGQHIPVKAGESKDSAVKEFIERKEAENAQKKKGEQIPKKDGNDENLPKLERNKPPPDEEVEELKKLEEEKQRELEEKKRKRKEQLSKDIDEVLKMTDTEKLRRGYVQMTEDTPQVLQDIGLKNTPLYIRTDHVYKCIMDGGVLKSKDDHYHGLGTELFMQIPELLEDPELVFKVSKNKEEDKEKIISVVKATDKNGKQIMVSIEINADIWGKNITANRITSAYGRKNLEKYIKTNATKERILYQKKQEQKESEKQQEQQMEKVTEDNKKEPTK